MEHRTTYQNDVAFGFHNAFPTHSECWKHVDHLFHRNTLSKKQTILNQGDMWNSVHYVHKGIARLFYSDQKGNEYNKDFFYEGNFFWPVAPSASKVPSVFSISSITDMELWSAPFDEFKQILQEKALWNSLALELAEALAERKILREAAFLLDTPAERYLNLFEEFSELWNRIPDYHMASFLGITQVSLSRIKKKLTQIS